MQGNEFKEKIIWFSDTEGKPMDYWTDRHNPNPVLRNRKILGMGILKNLKYHASTNTWEDGMVYDSKHGENGLPRHLLIERTIESKRLLAF